MYFHQLIRCLGHRHVQLHAGGCLCRRHLPFSIGFGRTRWRAIGKTIASILGHRHELQILHTTCIHIVSTLQRTPCPLVVACPNLRCPLPPTTPTQLLCHCTLGPTSPQCHATTGHCLLRSSFGSTICLTIEMSCGNALKSSSTHSLEP